MCTSAIHRSPRKHFMQIKASSLIIFASTIMKKVPLETFIFGACLFYSFVTNTTCIYCSLTYYRRLHMWTMAVTLLHECHIKGQDGNEFHTNVYICDMLYTCTRSVYIFSMIKCLEQNLNLNAFVM